MHIDYLVYFLFTGGSLSVAVNGKKFSNILGLLEYQTQYFNYELFECLYHVRKHHIKNLMDAKIS